MTDVSRVDHLTQSEELMLSQFKNSPNLLNLLKSYLTPVQELEDSLLDFMAANGINNAPGEMLDIIGSWMGVSRQGRLDGEYRTAILGRALTETSDGTTERFLSGFRSLINSDQARIYTYYPKDLYALAGEGWTGGLQEELKRIAPVGTSVHLLVGDDLNVLVPAAQGSEQGTLQDHTGEDYEVLVDGVPEPLYTTTITATEIFGTDVVLGWDGVSFENEAPAAFETTPFKIVSGLLVDQDGVQIVDDKGTPINVLEQVVI